ncbi:MAG: response regulator [Nitrospirae bacterium]|nr:MAG: response regulator [Nitrospirota bacterium]
MMLEGADPSRTSRRLLWLTAGIIVGMLLVGAATLFYLESRLVAMKGEALAVLAVNMADKLDQTLFERYGDIRVLARGLSTIRSPEAQTRYLYLFKDVYHYYHWLGVTDARGRIVAATDPASVGQDRSGEAWFQAVRDGQAVHLQDVQGSPESDGVRTVGFSAPLQGPGGESLGIVITQVGLDEVVGIVERTLAWFQGQHGERVEWQLLTRDDRLIVDSLLREEEGRMDLSSLPSMRAGATGEPGFTVERHLRRLEWVVTGYARSQGYGEFPGFQWRVLVRMDRRDVLVPIWTLLRQMSVAAVLIFLPLVGVLMWTASRLWIDEKEIWTSHEQYRATMASLPVSVVRLGKGLTIWFANRAFYDLVHQHPQESVGRPIGEVLPVKGLEEYLESALATCAGGGTATGRELECAMPTGERRVLRLTASGIRRDDYAAADLILIIEDTTERKQAQEVLRESEERFRLIMRHANDALFYLDVTGVVLWASHQAEVVTGRPMNELVGRPLMAVLSSQSKALAETRLAAVRQGKPVPTLVELEVIRSDGSSMGLEVSGTSVKTGEDVVGRLLVARDLSERRNMEQQLRQADKLAALGTLLGGVAHELNNPLFAMSGYIELVDEKVKQGEYEGLADDLAAMHEATLRATAIVERFLRVSRGGSGSREPCQINDLVQQTLDLAANNCTIHQITAHTNLQADLPLVLADASALGQVFLNLITNATQAMVSAHGKGILTVTTALVTDQSGAWVETRVVDDGPGIAPAYHARIFEPFFTTKPVGQGTGLGLHICHHIVTEFGGTLSMESVVGQGATFIVRLPVANEAVMRESVTSREVIMGGETHHSLRFTDDSVGRFWRATILVVVDERMSGDWLRAMLSRHGHEVFIAAGGKEGLEQFRRHRPQITLLDLHMPDMDGIDVLKQIRALDPRAAVLILTGRGTETQENQAWMLGVTDFLRKGLSLEALLGALEQVRTMPAPGPPIPGCAPDGLSDNEHPASILVVDDEAMVSSLLAEFLGRRGYRVRTAANGREALALVEQEIPQMIVLDMYMPGMNGVEVLRALRARQYTGGVLVLTASQDEKLLQEALGLGSVDVIGKPVNLERLVLAIQVGLGSQAGESRVVPRARD